MSEAGGTDRLSLGGRPVRGMGLLNRLAASRAFQSWAARVPGLRRIARAEGEALFADIAGFVRSQVLMALVELDLLSRLGEMPATPEALALRSGIAPARLDVLLQAGAAMGLLRRRRDGRFVLARRGAAILGVPGLPAMIRHHRVLYRDLSDPVAFLRGETDPDLARFWPYVFGAAAAEDPETARHYSGLMADSQVLVAEDTLRLADLTGVRHLMDVGGGTGAFLTAVAQAQPGLSLTLFDLPAVLAGAGMALARDGLGDRVTLASGSFRDDPLPAGADAISLVRVLYDHSDETVAALLSKVFDALPPRGRIVVSEPMSGGAQPDPVTDTYFAFYTMAMRTGRTRSGEEIAGFLARAGFGAIRVRPGYRPFVTSVVEARRPDSPAG